MAEEREVYHIAALALVGGEISRKLLVGKFLFGEQAHGVGIYVKRFLETAAAEVLHRVPILETVAHKRVRRHGGDGFVEIADLDRGKRYFLHSAVDAEFFNSYPVAYFEHIVGRKLDTSHETEDRILEYEHQHRGSRTEANQYCQWVAPESESDSRDTAEAVNDDAGKLKYAE